MKVEHARHETDDGREYALVSVNRRNGFVDWTIEIRSDEFDTITVPCVDEHWSWHAFYAISQATE